MADTFKADAIITETSKAKKVGFGFSDPTGEMPTAEYHYRESLNKVATGDDIDTIDLKGGDPNIDLKELYTKPTTGSQYGDVSVRRTKSGHVMVFDDTNGSESIMIKHKDGSGFVLQSDGTMVLSTKNNRVTQVGGTDALLIEGDLRISTQNLEIDATGDLDLRVGGDYNLTVGGEKKETVNGSSTEVVKGNIGSKVQGHRSEHTTKSKTKTVFGDEENIIKGNATYSIGGNFDLGATGYSKITSEQQIAYSAPVIDIVGVKGQMTLKQGVFGGASSFYYGLNYYGRSAKFDKGVTAPTFHGDLQGTALEAMRSNEAGIHSASSDYSEGDGGHGGSSLGFTITDVDTDLDRANKGPSDDSIKDHLSGDPRGIKKISIDADGTLTKKFTKKEYTVATARAALKDPALASDATFIKGLIEDELISDSYFQKIPPSIGRVTNGKSAYLPYNSIGYSGNANLVTGQRNTKRYIPDTLYDPNAIDPRGGLNMITSKTLLSAAIPISTFLAGVNGAASLGHIDKFEERQSLARQLLLQSEVLKLSRNNEGRFKNYRLVVAEGVSKETHTSGSIPDLRKSGEAITYELYDDQNRNLTDVSYEFASYLSDQLGLYDKIILDYDTVAPNGTLPHEKINTQIVVIMPKVDKEYKLQNNAEFKLETKFNNTVQSNSDLVEVTLDTVTDITFEPTTPHKSGKQYSSADFVGSRFASNIAIKVNELHPKIRTKVAGAVQDYIRLYKDDLRDINITEAYRSPSKSNQLKAKGVKAAAGGFSWHNYGAAVDIAIYVDGVYDDGRNGIDEYTGRLRKSFIKFNLYNGLNGDSGHFWPRSFPATPPKDLRKGVISLDDYVDQNLNATNT